MEVITERMGELMEGYKHVSTLDLHVGDEVIVEHLHWDYKTGQPVESSFYRAIVDQHRTVVGMAFDLVSEPSVYWPEIPPWMNGKIYAGNDSNTRMWMREET